jgi:MoaA/NifB/PqqE/SkfB family radical SAM enzyme
MSKYCNHIQPPTSKYWDDFDRRAKETVKYILNGQTPPVRRVALYVTDACNFKCRYCNHTQAPKSMTKETFDATLSLYGKDVIYHITGGEPSMVTWLYPAIAERHLQGYTINLNTNCYIIPPAPHVKRLKVSLDDYYSRDWDFLVGVSGAHRQVVRNIKWACNYTDLSITFTMSKANYKKTVYFADWAQHMFYNDGLYAIFFSVYKGTNPEYAWDNEAVNDFWDNYRPYLIDVLDDESRALFLETMDEKRRLMQGIRFEGNIKQNDCYLAMSERVVGPDGNVSNCSHLYRDGIRNLSHIKHEKCQYGCNRRLVKFNQEVESKL